MITMIEQIAAGNALRVFLQPPGSAVSWRLLRKTTDDIASETDPDAAVVYEGDEKVVADVRGLLLNDIPYYYRPFYFDGQSWSAADSQSGTPAATYAGLTVDAPSFIRERIDLGLKSEIKRGLLVHKNAKIAVLTAPPEFDKISWPLVTVHVQHQGPQERGVGEIVAIDAFQEMNGWQQAEGWLQSVTLQVIAWSQNPDERNILRQALQRIIIANLPVLDSVGIVEPEFSQQDTEDFESYNAPVYQSVGTFNCVAPALVGSNVGAIDDVISSLKE